MPNGRPGDHPLTDITVHKTLTYSRKADGEIPMAEFEAVLGEILDTIQEAGETISKKDAQALLRETHKEIESRFKK